MLHPWEWEGRDWSILGARFLFLGGKLDVSLGGGGGGGGSCIIVGRFGGRGSFPCAPFPLSQINPWKVCVVPFYMDADQLQLHSNYLLPVIA